MAEHEPRAVCTVLLKGGTTCTTMAANTCEALGARRGHNVLAIDGDPNGHLTANLGYNDLYEKDEVNIGDVILPNGGAEPDDVIIDTGLGFDLVPATTGLEGVNHDIKSQVDFRPSEQLKTEFVDPLLGTEYDYIIIDTHSSRNMLMNNAVVAAPNLILPMTPEQGTLNGLQKTTERIIKPLRKRLGLELLATVPNRMGERIDYETADRILLKRLMDSENLRERVPNFAYLSPDELEEVKNGSWSGPLPKPGIREDKDIGDAFENSKTLGAYNPDNPQLEYFDELAEIVERGEVVRDD